MIVFIMLIFGDFREALQSWCLSLINVHVLEFWGENSTLDADLSHLAHVDSLLNISSLREFLLVHAQLFLVLLETHVDTMDENLAVDVFLRFGLTLLGLLPGRFLLFLLV